MTPGTLLLRQAHPAFMDGDRLTSQVFMPFPKDEGLLSVYDGDQVSAAESFAHYTKVLGLASRSVWAVSKTEADGATVVARPDPLKDFAAHAVIDFTGKSDKECRKIAKKLRDRAMERGCQHRPI